jgi:hypothetical protein
MILQMIPPDDTPDDTMQYSQMIPPDDTPDDTSDNPPI